ncbi:MAG TPA: N-6 DNA methylase [Kofleriaceae bacterium]|nr:N-6 DNA methylase [Kofleriaceae bacterium]
MASRRARTREAQLAFDALSIEGGLLSPEWLSKVAQLQAGTQAEADYRIPKGLNLRDEIGRYWRIAQAHWAELKTSGDAKTDAKMIAERFVLAVLRDAFGFSSLLPVPPAVLSERTYPIGHASLGGRVPVVIAPTGSGLDTLSPAFGDGTRRRSAFGLAQEYLNAQEGALWGIASDGVALRIVRDNASLTRPAWIEADLQRIFAEDRYADFAAFWLLCHETRFGREGQPVTECALEAWRTAGREEGTRAREHLRRGVEEALVALGQGFLLHSENGRLRAELQNGTLPVKEYFNQLLRLVYRLIFLLTVEERGLLHQEGTSDATRELFANGYGIRRLRERSAKRSAHDRFADLWDATKVVCRGLATGEPRLGLPALAGIFAANQCPALDSAKLENRALLLAVFKLAWLRENGSLARVNWRDMGPEELGSVYESLLELVPQIATDGRRFAFASGGEAKGNARKTTGSYYTPDSLVQVLLDSALEPVIAETIAKNPANAFEALLGLAIVDPACGSGHFLLAAARRLAGHVARLQANGTPSAAEYRHALRQVVGRCIFGVDLNLMAVELCKVGLWMEAVEPGLPLTFLDSHIQHGNALLGTTPELMAKGIPDAAWDPIEGDDKKAASALKKRNKQHANEKQQGFGFLATTGATETQQITTEVTSLDQESDTTLDGVQAKASHWERIQSSPEWKHQKLVADAWCAAFVWPKQEGTALAAPTNEVWRALRDATGQLPLLTATTVQQLTNQYRFFHWHLQFPQIFAKGGFDVVLGNPPWERVKLQEQEFFASRSEEIAKAVNAAERKKLIASLPDENAQLWEEWSTASRKAEGESHSIRQSGRYPLCGKGDVNTYAVFAEHNNSALASRGRAGFIVPTGIATDDSTKAYFQSLVDGERLVSLFDFQSGGELFGDVGHARFKFCLLTIGASKTFVVAFGLRATSQLADPGRLFDLTPADIALINPNTRTCPVFRTRTDAEITKAIYRRIPILIREARKGEAGEASNGNPWRIQLARMFDMSNDSHMFRTRAQLGSSGWRLSGNVFISESGRMLPLYEGRLAHQFNHRYAQEPDGQLVEASDAQLRDPSFVVEPHYWVPEQVAGEMLHRRKSECRSGLLGFRRVARPGDERTVIAAILPWGPASYGFIMTVGPRAEDLLLLCGIYNSFVFDYLARSSLSQPSFPQSTFQQLAAPSPSQIDSVAVFLGQTMRAFVVPRVFELTYTAVDLTAFAHDVGYDGLPFPWDGERRFQIRCELDAALFHLYGLSRADVEHVLDTFHIVRRDDERAHDGKFRTKDTILGFFDAMAEASRRGKPYQTRLSPPPADPRVGHPSREGGKVIPLPVEPRVRPLPSIAPTAPVVPDLTTVAAKAWTRPHSMERGEIQAAIIAVLKANGAAMDRRVARLASLLCLEPHLMAAMLNKTEKSQWSRVVGVDAKKAASASIDATSQEWGAALAGLRGRERVLEDLQLNTWTLGTGTDAIDTSGWPEGRAEFVVNVLRRLQQSTQLEAIILKLPTTAQQWLANAA